MLFSPFIIIDTFFFYNRRILGASAQCQESQLGKRKTQALPPPPGGAQQQQHCRVNITGNDSITHTCVNIVHYNESLLLKIKLAACQQ